MIPLRELLDALWRGTSRTRFVHAAARKHRHNVEHLGAGSQLQERPKVRQVISEDVACHGDSVETCGGTLTRSPHRLRGRHNLDVKTGGVVVLEVPLYLLDKYLIMSAVCVHQKMALHGL